MVLISLLGKLRLSTNLVELGWTGGRQQAFTERLLCGAMGSFTRCPLWAIPSKEGPGHGPGRGHVGSKQGNSLEKATEPQGGEPESGWAVGPQAGLHGAGDRAGGPG